MNTTQSFKNSHPGNGKARRQRFTVEEDGRVVYCEFFLRFVMLTCLLFTLAICLVNIATPASAPADAALAADASGAPAAKKTTPAVTVRITLPGGFRL